MRRSSSFLIAAVIAAAASSCATPQAGTPARTSTLAPPAPTATVPSLDAIRSDELTSDLFTLAGDAMRGREAGTIDELRASGWLVEQLHAIGLEPAGEDGTYYQWWPMRRIRQSDVSSIRVAGQPLRLWDDVALASTVDAQLDVPLVYVGRASEAEVQGVDLTGKAAVALLVPPSNPPDASVSLAGWRYTSAAVRAQATRLTRLGAAAVVLVADSVAEGAMGFFSAFASRGSYGLDTTGAPTRPRAGVPVLLVRQRWLEPTRAPGARLVASLTSESFSYPSVNIVAKATGSDPRRRNEYVLFSAHQDHDGVRFPMDGDSIWNGADDNTTVSVALLAIARAWKKQPNPRSALWIWHGAEEKGLLGSRWHALHPMVPIDQIIAVLNADMIGRNNPDSAALLGVQPPHRNSSDLVALALQANALTGRFKLDSLWDRPTHPEGWYFRSDHLPYARLNIPALMYSTNLHPDYHTARDNPDRIDIGKLRRMTQWMYATGWLVGTAPSRPRVDSGFRLER